MRVREVMSREVRTLRPEEEVGLFSFSRLGQAPLLAVTDSRGRLRGTVSRLSLLQGLAQAGSLQSVLRADQVLARQAPSVRESDPLEVALERMAAGGVQALAVVDQAGAVVGAVTDADLLQGLANEQLAHSRLMAMRVDDLMTSDPVSLGPDATLEEAVGLLIEKGVRHLPVVDDEGRLLGIVSERDLRTRLGKELRELAEAPVEALEERLGDLMTPDPLSVQAGARLADAVEALTRERVGALPVVDEGERVLGILSYVDVLGWMLGRAPGEPAPEAWSRAPRTAQATVEAPQPGGR